MKPLEIREKEFKIKFEDRFPNFEYIKGYVICESKIICKCKICGSLKERSAQCIRAKKEVRCDECFKEIIDINNTAKMEIIKREKEQRLQRLQIQNRKKIGLEAKRKLLKEPIKCVECGILFSRNSSRQIRCNSCIDKYNITKAIEKTTLKEPICCKECGASFIRLRPKQTYCSDICRSKYEHRRNDIKRRHKLKKNGKIDWDISIERLIKRNGNKCKICGGEVDLKDYYYDDGCHMAGNKYPSIDHIKPVNKGGTHTWNNVQLAHRYCNSIKCDNETYEGECGQIKFAL